MNDGRAPDSNRDLGLTKRSAGRPRGSRNIVPTLNTLRDFKTFGIPWRFKYGILHATNTCAMDTGLMILFFLQDFNIFIIPDNEQTALLKSVLTDIGNNQYDKARFDWLTRGPMKSIPQEGTILDCWMSMYSAVGRGVRDLFRITIETNCYCSNKLTCPEPIKCTTVLPCFKIHNKETTNSQGALDLLLEHHSEKHHAKPLDPVEFPEHLGYGFHLPSLDLTGDNTGSTFTYTCGGMLVQDSLEINCPPILTFAMDQHYDIQFLNRHLNVRGKAYQLTAVVWHSGSHFACTFFVHNGCVFYDGMKTPKCKWVKWDFRPSEKYICNGAWYIETKQETVKQENMDDSSSTSSSESAIPEPRPKKKIQTIKEKSVPQNFEGKKRAYYPVGLSVHRVSSHGKQPVCTSCQQAIARGQLRVVNQIITNERLGYKTSCSIHHDIKCLTIAVGEAEATRILAK
jgi:hypothetical protein